MDTEHTEDLAEEGLQQFRIERGAQVLGADGMLGTVHQVVMDQTNGRLQSLVVRGEAGMDYELPADYIETATGDEVRLNIGRTDLANHPNLAHPYEPEMYTPVESGQVMPPSAAADQAQDNPVLTNIEEDAVDVVAPASDIAPDTTTAMTPDMTSGISTAAPLRDDLGTAEATGDELAEVDEIEAVIIPGDQPGEADVFIAGASDIPATGAMTPAETGSWTPTRGPQGADYRGPGGRSLVGVLAATGVLLFTGGAIATYLLVRRNQEHGSLGARMRQQAGNAAGNAAALRDAVRAQSQARWSDLGARARDQQRQVRDRMNAWVPAAASSLAALRDRAVERGNALGDTVRQQARQTANATNRAVAPSGSARRTANRLSDRLSDRASDLRDQLSDRASDLRDRLTAGVNQAQKQVRPAATWRRMRWSARAGALWQQLRDIPDQAADTWGRLARRTTRTAAKTNTQAVKSAQKTARTVQRATANAGKQAKQARANARRGVRRMRRRARWFRNGIVAGVIGGVLYAPQAGRDTRTTLAGWLSRIPGLDTFFAPTTSSAGSTRSTGMTAGAAGPHPQSTLPDARESWRGMDTTPSTLSTTSEQPGGRPLAPDLTPEDMPGPAI